MSSRPVDPVIETAGEARANAWTHGLSAVAAAVVTGIMTTMAAEEGAVLAVVTLAIFGTALVLVFGLSTAYHAIPLHRPRTQRVMRKLDHAAIYVLIAATYTPIMLVAVGGTWGISMTGVVWFIALVGIVLSTCCFDRWPWLQLGLKVGLGWIVFTAIVPIVTSLSTPGLLCLLAGGAAYTAGVAFFLWERLRFNHAIWHVFVILGAAFHTAVMFLDVLR